MLEGQVVQRHHDEVVVAGVHRLAPSAAILDGDEAAVRALVSILFTPSQIRKVEDFINEHANQVVDRMVGQGEAEVYNGFAREMTFYVIITLLGVPMSEAQNLLQRVENNTTGRIGEPDGTGGVQAGTLTFGLAYEYFLEKVREARANPTTGVLGTLANATFRDGSLPSTDAPRPHTLTLDAHEEAV